MIPLSTLHWNLTTLLEEGFLVKRENGALSSPSTEDVEKNHLDKSTGKPILHEGESLCLDTIYPHALFNGCLASKTWIHILPTRIFGYTGYFYARESRVNTIIKETHDLYHKYLNEYETAYAPSFWAYFENGCKGITKEEDLTLPQRKQITDLYRSTHEFFSALKNGDKKASCIFHNYLCKDCLKYLKEMKNICILIHFHGLLMQEIPFKMLIDIAFKPTAETINDREFAEKFNSFVQRVNEREIGGKVLHEVFSVVIQSFALRFSRQNWKLALGQLEYFMQLNWLDLQRAGLLTYSHLELFDECDPGHMGWRNSLKQGSVICSSSYLNSIPKAYEIELGEQLGARKEEEKIDYNVFFAIEKFYFDTQETADGGPSTEFQQKLSHLRQEGDSSQFVFWTCVNRPLLFIKYYQEFVQNIQDHALKTNPILYLDPKGFAIVQRLYPRPIWSGLEKAEKKKYIQVFAELMAVMTENNASLHYLEGHRLMFNSATQLRATNALYLDTQFNLARVEKMVWEVAERDLEIFQRIMAGADIQGKIYCLYDHSLTTFYRAAVEDAFNPDTAHIEALAEQNNLHYLEDDLAGLREETRAVRDSCIKEIFGDNLVGKDKINRIEALIILYYQQGKTISFLLPNLIEQVKKAFSTPLKGSAKTKPSTVAEDEFFF